MDYKRYGIDIDASVREQRAGRATTKAMEAVQHRVNAAALDDAGDQAELHARAADCEAEAEGHRHGAKLTKAELGDRLQQAIRTNIAQLANRHAALEVARQIDDAPEADINAAKAVIEKQLAALEKHLSDGDPKAAPLIDRMHPPTA